jgi:hypothetical protein
MSPYRLDGSGEDYPHWVSETQLPCSRADYWEWLVTDGVIREQDESSRDRLVQSS